VQQLHIGSNEFSERALESPDTSHHAINVVTCLEGSDVGTDFFDNTRHVDP